MNKSEQYKASDITVKSSDWTVETADGRSIIMRKPPNSSICLLSDILGEVPDRTFNIYMPLLWIHSIDGEYQSFGNRSGMDALLNSLGDAYAEVVAGMSGGPSKADEVTAAKK